METLKRGLKVGLKTTWALGKVIFPITLIVTWLSYTPVMDGLTRLLAPWMAWIGLSGETAIPLVLGNVLNLYAAIGAMLSMELTVKEVFILAVMLSFSHNLLVESVVAAKVGVRISVILAVRIGLAVFSALVIHLFWQGGEQVANYGFVSNERWEEVSGFWSVFLEGLASATAGVFQLALIVIPLMIGIQYMKEHHFLDVFSKGMAPLIKILGLGKNTSTTLASGLIFGLAYGAGVMIQSVKEDGVKKKDLYLAFIFLVACHAVIEDTLLFLPLGIPLWPLLFIRMSVAILFTMIIAYIWKRLEKHAKVMRKGATYEN